MLLQEQIFISARSTATSSAQNIVSGRGSVNLLLDNGNGYIQQIAAPQNAIVLANGDILNIGLINSENITLKLAGMGGVATIGEMLFGNSVNVTADNSHILTLIHTSPNSALFDITTTRGGFNQRPRDPGIILTNILGTSEYRSRANILNSSRQWKAQRILIDKTTDVPISEEKR